MSNDASDHCDHRQQGQQEATLDQAAKLIETADILLIATGAGFSADSGLPTYADVAKNPIYESLGIEYGDLCRVECLKDNPKLFYGFWGTCFNLYQRQVQPHAGYQILKAWCDEKQAKLNQRKKSADVSAEALDNLKSAYYLYTSNVDGHFRMAGFPNEWLHEVHGAIDTWIPSGVDDDDDSGGGLNAASHQKEQYQVSDSYSFPIDSETLHGPSIESLRESLIPETSSKKSSTLLLRPRVLMFDDGFPSHTQMGLDTSCAQYQAWEETMEAAMMEGTSRHSNNDHDDSMKLVILEIGCGIRVPSVRIECQDVLHDTAARCHISGDDDSRCSLIRINPDHETIEQAVPSNATGVSIRGKGLETLQAIQERINKMKKA